MDATSAATPERRCDLDERLDRGEITKEFPMSDKFALMLAIAAGIVLAVVLAWFELV